MERYRILDHTADAKFRAFGATLEDVFANAALATASLMYDWEKVERRVEYPIAVEGRDPEQLLNKFLSEMIYLIDAKRFVLGGAEDVKIEIPSAKDQGSDRPFRLTARFVGDDRLENYEFHGDIKAVTYNEMKIESCACGPAAWMVQVVVDI